MAADEADRLAGELAAVNASLRAATKVNALLALAVQHMPNAVLIADGEGFVLWTNAAWERLSGRSTEQSIRRRLEGLMADVINGFNEDDGRRLVALGQPVSLEAKSILPDRRTLWFSLRFEPVRNQAGSVVNHIVLVDDVTSRHEAETAQRSMEKQLFQLQKMETVGTLTGGIAHDFNNLLTGIIANQELAMEDLSPGHPARRCVEEAHEATRNACELVEKILALSRQAAGDRIPVDLGLMVEEARQLFRATLPPSIQVEAQVDPDCGLVMGDHGQLSQILLNLGMQAAEPMRATGGTLRLTLAPTFVAANRPADQGSPKPGSYLRLTVADTLREPPSDARRQALAVVSGIVRAHGGSVDTRATGDAGFSVDVYLPVASARDQVEPAASAETPPRGSGQRVWVVDNEQVVAQTAVLHLERLGYVAEVFHSPTKCLDALKAMPGGCDLLLTDQSMPEMEGLSLARAVRAIAPGLPVLVMSGYLGNLAPETMREIGRVSVVAKPFRVLDLARALNRALSPRPPG